MPNELLGYIKEKDLTHKDVIALIDEHLKKAIEASNDKLSPEEKKALEQKEKEEKEKLEKEKNSTSNVQDTENDENEQNSESQLKKKMEELDKNIAEVKEKAKNLDKYIAKIKRKDPPSGDISDEALHPNEHLRNDSFEVDA